MLRMLQPEDALTLLRQLSYNLEQLPDSMTYLLHRFCASAEKEETAEILQHHEEELNDLLQRLNESAHALRQDSSEAAQFLLQIYERIEKLFRECPPYL